MCFVFRLLSFEKKSMRAIAGKKKGDSLNGVTLPFSPWMSPFSFVKRDHDSRLFPRGRKRGTGARNVPERKAFFSQS